MSTTYKNVFSILLTRLNPNAEEIIGDHQCGFRRNRSTIDHTFGFGQIFFKKNGYTMKQCTGYL
jgi:hypothetical protein